MLKGKVIIILLTSLIYGIQFESTGKEQKEESEQGDPYQILNEFLHQQNPLHKTNQELKTLWDSCGISEEVSFNAFQTACSAIQYFTKDTLPDLLTIIDYTQPSTKERFFVIDLKNRKLLFKSLVAHGKNSGNNYATKFSNTSKSLQSSPGLFKTAETYHGKHGFSLRLDGLEEGLNDKARKRSIVIHGAAYVSASFAKKHGRLGRSWGCPALPIESTEKIITKIKKGSYVFIYTNDEEYFEKSTILNKHQKMQAPINIESKRLQLRSIQKQDAEAVFQYRSDKSTNQYQSWIPENSEEVVHFIAEKTNPEFNITGTWHQLVLIEKSNSKIIGDLGIHFISDKEIELGCTISIENQKQGFAKEAIIEIIKLCFQHYQKEKVCTSIDPRNKASIALVESLGFKKGTLKRKAFYMHGEWVDDISYDLVRYINENNPI